MVALLIPVVDRLPVVLLEAVTDVVLIKLRVLVTLLVPVTDRLLLVLLVLVINGVSVML